MPQPSSKEFLDKFLESYNSCYQSIPQDKRRDVWQLEWNHFMLWESETRPPHIKKSVLIETARKLCLSAWPGEAFTFDIAFYSSRSERLRGFPFPIVVALEHELDYRGFEQEIVKLLSVRCPLKVGLTYTGLFRDGSIERDKQLSVVRG